jgi:FMN phosphatase YigB (HAD superfamily)
LLIIFDLDDTLIDTSGCVTGPRLNRALDAMIQEGLAMPDLAQGLELLRTLNETTLSAREALCLLVEHYRGDPSLADIGQQVLEQANLGDVQVEPLKGARELLTELQRDHQLALVTVGRPSFQMHKLEKAGIDPAVFSKIFVSREVDKRPLYEQVMEELGCFAHQGLVCGDRIERDLTPGRQLGLTTVLMRWGRGLIAKMPHPDVDYAITALDELKGMVTR